MMQPGERQVAPTLDGIRRDHTARYEWAAKVMPPNSRVIDAACGIGYGSMIMAEAGHTVRAFDIDNDALVYADNNYAHERVTYNTADLNGHRSHVESDVAVSFETIEHLLDPRPLLKSLRAAPMLIASVPNEAVFPFSPAEGITTAFHHRHYLRVEFEALLTECGWHVIGWYGQEGNESEVEPDLNGRTLIAVCQRDVVPDVEPEGKHVAILGLGPSLSQYLELVKRKGGRSAFCDEVWTINALGDVFACDLVFHMDDVRIQEIRAEANPAGNIAAMLPWLKTSKVPVVTSRAHPDYPALVEFPLEDVLNHFGHDYFNNTTAYAVAFAIHAGFKKISLFGIDFSYANTHQAEKGRACVEYWLGQAQARDVKLLMPKTSSLMDACNTRSERLYGYDTVDVKFNLQPDGAVKLDFVPKEVLPTAAEIEASYDHSAPISEQHRKKESP